MNCRLDAATAAPVAQAVQTKGSRACMAPANVADEAVVEVMSPAVAGETDALVPKEHEYMADVFTALDELSSTAAP